MRRQRDRSPVPAGWQRELDEKADLEASFAALAGCRHFYADTLRGRIRSLQLRPKAAWAHFHRAFSRAGRVDETIPNLVRQFFTSLYCVDNVMVEGPLKPGLEIPSSWFPELPDFIFAEYPELRLVHRARILAEGLLRIHAGDVEGAAETLEGILDLCAPGDHEPRVRALIGHAAALSAMDDTDHAIGRLEAAGLELQLTSSTLTRAWQGSILAAAYEYLELADDAQAWRQFVEALPCPEATKAVFSRRAERMLRRSRKAGRMMVL